MIITNYKDFINENLSDFDFKGIFLELTEYTIPYGYEEKLEPILYKYIPNLKKDSIGNYYIKIGNSKTLFTSHLDTYSKRYEKVNHIIRKSVIRTDETTILGGDNKNGVLILMYMIHNNIPGTYYFFIGEEGIVTGESCNGSSEALEKYPELFNNFDRAIAFDRRGEGSIVVKQRGRMTCSTEFADALVESFENNGLKFTKDYAYGTDSAVFLDVIPEITNISSSGKFEHSFLESTNIKYLKKVANASINIKWEELPTVRIPESVITEFDDVEVANEINEQSKKTFNRVLSLLGTKGFNCINRKDFMPNAVMQFHQFIEDNFINLKILGDDVKVISSSDYVKEFKEGTFEEFAKTFNLSIKDYIKGIIGGIVKKMNIDYELPLKDLLDILDDYKISFEEFKNFITESDYSEYFKFYDDKIYMDVKAGQSTTIKRQQEQEIKKPT